MLTINECLAKIDKKYHNKIRVVNFPNGMLTSIEFQYGCLKYVGLTDCSYCYINGIKRISRQHLQKRPKGKTEKEYADDLGLVKLNLTPNLIYMKEF